MILSAASTWDSTKQGGRGLAPVSLLTPARDTATAVLRSLRKELDETRRGRESKVWRTQAAKALRIRRKHVRAVFPADGLGDMLVVYFDPPTAASDGSVRDLVHTRRSHEPPTARRSDPFHTAVGVGRARSSRRLVAGMGWRAIPVGSAACCERGCRTDEAQLVRVARALLAAVCRRISMACVRSGVEAR
jgi:hypothetical protein